VILKIAISIYGLIEKRFYPEIISANRFFTEKSLGSAWVDREIKHVLREEMQRGNDFDLSKIISIFDSESTYKEINKRYSELTDDLLHLMPIEYSKLQLGQLVSAIWSKYLDLQGGDIETQRQLLSKEKEIFQKEKEIEDLKQKLHNEKSKNPANQLHGEFEKYVKSEKLTGFLKQKDQLLTAMRSPSHSVSNLPELIAFGLVTHLGSDSVQITPKGQDFLKWYILEYPEKDPHTDNERDT
jgi:valyl-tRNA synthetase